MRISHYFEWSDSITGGHSQSVENQRKILESPEIGYTVEPDLSCDILHLNNMGPKSIYYARKAQSRDIKVVIHGHQTAEDFKNSFAFSNYIAKPLKPYLRYAYSLADHIICPSKHNKRVLDNYTDVDKTVISNGFDPDKLSGYKDLRSEYLDKFDLEPPIVFNIGHVIERKGLETFIETARKMPDTDFVWFGYLKPMGGGNLIDEILVSRKARKLVNNSPDNCQFTGYIEDIRGAFAAGDIFFFPSKNENEGMALLEAMYCGKPPVIRDIEVYKWLKHGENCLKQEKNFEKSINKLKNKKTRKKMATKANKTSKKFKLDKVGEELVSLYQDLV